MPSNVASSTIHAIIPYSLHPSIQTKKTKKTKAKLVGPHERPLEGVLDTIIPQWTHAMGGKGAHACLLILKTLVQELAVRYFEPGSGTLPGHGRTRDTHRWKDTGIVFLEQVSDLRMTELRGRDSRNCGGTHVKL